MDKRFVLSAAGIAGATVAAPALAQDATITLHLDYWAAEHGMSAQAADRGLSSYVDTAGYINISSTGSIIASSVFTAWNSTASAYTSGYRLEFQLTNATGDYSVLLTDAYGDGWAWNSVSGDDAFTASGAAVVGGPVVIGLTTGNSASGSFSVVPAPGALALLGLAGLAGRRKRA